MKVVSQPLTFAIITREKTHHLKRFFPVWGGHDGFPSLTRSCVPNLLNLNFPEMLTAREHLLVRQLLAIPGA